MRSNEERAWAAGFFDGEGCIGFHKAGSPTIYRLSLQIAQTRKEPLERFAACVGIGKIFGPYNHKSNKHAPYYEYAARGYKRVTQVMQVVLPWLSLPKREQAEKALAEAEIYRARPRKTRSDKGTKGIRTKRATKAHPRTKSADLS